MDGYGDVHIPAIIFVPTIYLLSFKLFKYSQLMKKKKYIYIYIYILANTGVVVPMYSLFSILKKFKINNKYINFKIVVKYKI